MHKFPTDQSTRRYPSAQRVLVLVVVLVLAWLTWSLRSTLVPYIVGVLIVLLLAPLVGYVEKYVPGRKLTAPVKHRIAALVVYVVVALAVVVFLIFLARPILNRMGDMILGVPLDWQKAISENPTIHAWYVDAVPADIRAQIETSLTEASVDVASWLERTVMAAIDTASGLINAVITIAAVGLFVFYVMIRDERIPTAATAWISPGWRLHLQYAREIVHRTVTSYARSLLTEASIVGSLTGIGLFLAGVDAALPLGIVGGLFNLVPYLGYWLALLLSIVVVAGTQPDKLPLAILIYFLVQSADNWYFAPHFQGASTGWTPAQTLVIMACGSALIGPIGLIISLPLAAFAREILLYAYSELGPARSRDHDVSEPKPEYPDERVSTPSTLA